MSKRRLKRVLSLFLTLVLVLELCPTTIVNAAIADTASYGSNTGMGAIEDYGFLVAIVSIKNEWKDLNEDTRKAVLEEYGSAEAYCVDKWRTERSALSPSDLDEYGLFNPVRELNNGKEANDGRTYRSNFLLMVAKNKENYTRIGRTHFMYYNGQPHQIGVTGASYNPNGSAAETTVKVLNGGEWPLATINWFERDNGKFPDSTKFTFEGIYYDAFVEEVEKRTPGKIITYAQVKQVTAEQYNIRTYEEIEKEFRESYRDTFRHLGAFPKVWYDYVMSKPEEYRYLAWFEILNGLSHISGWAFGDEIWSYMDEIRDCNGKYDNCDYFYPIMIVPMVAVKYGEDDRLWFNAAEYMSACYNAGPDGVEIFAKDTYYNKDYVSNPFTGGWNSGGAIVSYYEEDVYKNNLRGWGKQLIELRKTKVNQSLKSGRSAWQQQILPATLPSNPNSTIDLGLARTDWYMRYICAVPLQHTGDDFLEYGSGDNLECSNTGYTFICIGKIPLTVPEPEIYSGLQLTTELPENGAKQLEQFASESAEATESVTLNLQFAIENEANYEKMMQIFSADAIELYESPTLSIQIDFTKDAVLGSVDSSDTKSIDKILSVAGFDEWAAVSYDAAKGSATIEIKDITMPEEKGLFKSGTDLALKIVDEGIKLTTDTMKQAGDNYTLKLKYEAEGTITLRYKDVKKNKEETLTVGLTLEGTPGWEKEDENVTLIQETASAEAVFTTSVIPEKEPEFIEPGGSEEPYAASYYSEPVRPYAEIKDINEDYEAMAGVPTTEDLYCTFGGTEFILSMDVEGHKSTGVREYNLTYTAGQCWEENAPCTYSCPGTHADSTYAGGCGNPTSMCHRRNNVHVCNSACNGERGCTGTKNKHEHDADCACNGGTSPAVSCASGPVDSTSVCECGAKSHTTTFKPTYGSGYTECKDGNGANVYTGMGCKHTQAINGQHPHTHTFTAKITQDIEEFHYIDITALELWRLNNYKLKCEDDVNLFTQKTYDQNTTTSWRGFFSEDSYADSNGRLVFNWSLTNRNDYGNTSATTSVTVNNLKTECDKLATEWFNAQVNGKSIKATVISDFLNLKTSYGNQTASFHKYDSDTVEFVDSDPFSEGSDSKTATANPITFTTLPEWSEIWESNGNSFSGWGVNDIVFSGYNGNYSNPDRKFRNTKLFTKDTDVTEAYKNHPNVQSGGIESGFVSNTANVKTMTLSPLNIIDSTDSNRNWSSNDALEPVYNGQKDTGRCYISYNKDISFATLKIPTTWTTNALWGTPNKCGGDANTLVREAVYTDNKTSVNDIVIYNPIANTNSYVVGRAAEYDQRTTSSLEVSKDIVDESSEVCPENSTCGYATLNCSITPTAHTEACYEEVPGGVSHSGYNVHVCTSACTVTVNSPTGTTTYKICEPHEEVHQHTADCYENVHLHTDACYTAHTHNAGTCISGTFEVSSGTGYSGQVYTWTATEDCEITFYSTSYTDDPKGTIQVKRNGSIILDQTDDDSGGGRHFKVTASVKKGDIVICKTSYYSSGSSGTAWQLDKVVTCTKARDLVCGFPEYHEHDDSCYKAHVHTSSCTFTGGHITCTDCNGNGYKSKDCATDYWLSGDVTYYRCTVCGDSGPGLYCYHDISCGSCSGTGYTSTLVYTCGITQDLACTIDTTPTSCGKVPGNVYTEPGTKIFNTHVCNNLCKTGEPIKVLICKDPHHYVANSEPWDPTNIKNHYSFGDLRCWEPCHNDENHKRKGTVVVNGAPVNLNDTFINIDVPFQIYSDTIGDFAQVPTMWGIGECTSVRGKGYYNNMNTDTWVRDKFVTLPVNVLDEHGNLRLANEPIDLLEIGSGPYYTFTPILMNDESSNAQVYFTTIANNCAESTFYQDNDATTNRERDSFTKSAKHTVQRNQTMDVVGSIGSLVIEDTGDFRFSTLFKEEMDPNDVEDWYIEGVINKVDASKGRAVVGGSTNVLQQGATAANKFYNTFGTLSTLLTLKLPLSSGYAKDDLLINQLVKPGYKVYADIQTVGNYFGENFNEDGVNMDTDLYYMMQITPRYWSLNLDTGVYTPVDVYIKEGGRYKSINKFDGSDPDYEFITTMNWEDEEARRNVTSTEMSNTRAVSSLFSGDTELKIRYPGTGTDALGTAQRLYLTDVNRTFIGSTKTLGQEQNIGNAFYNESFYRRAQRWHFTLELPSSSAFVEAGKECSTANINALAAGNTALLCSLNIKVRGITWTIEYEEPANTIEVLGRSYTAPIDPATGKPITDAVLNVYDSKKTSSVDIKTEGTH